MTASASDLAQIFRAHGETLAVAESCTGGLLGAILTELPGSSRWFQGGLIVYSNSLKTRLAGVSPGLLRREGAVSGRVAAALAAGVRTRTRSDWGVGITGIAGPGGGLPGKPVGLVFIGVSGPHGGRVTRCFLRGSRQQIRRQACQAAIQLLTAVLLSRTKSVGSEPDSSSDRKKCNRTKRTIGGTTSVSSAHGNPRRLS